MEFLNRLYRLETKGSFQDWSLSEKEKEKIMYVDLKRAREILLAREAIRQKVKGWWLETIGFFPDIFGEADAVIARHLPTFRYEDAVFAKLASVAGLRPVWVGYREDKLATNSSFKNSLIRPKFAVRIGRKGGVQLEKKCLVSANRYNGRPLSQVVCDGHLGESLEEFHLNQLRAVYGDAPVWDFSEVAVKLGKRPRIYYVHYLSLMVAHGVLFEDFHGGESGDKLNGFTTQVFEPAFREVERIFGFSPLVVPLPWRPEYVYYPSVELSSQLPWFEHPYAQI
jgi:hypothetical protein